MGHTGNLIGRIALWLVAALGILFFIMIYTGSETGIDGGLTLAYVAFALCAGMAVIFGVIHVIAAGKKALSSLIGLAAFGVLVAISYALADGTVRPSWDVTPEASRWIGAGIIATLLALGAAIVAIVFGEIARMLK